METKEKELRDYSIKELEDHFNDQESYIRLVEREDGAVEVYGPSSDDYDSNLEPSLLKAVFPKNEFQQWELMKYLCSSSLTLILIGKSADWSEGNPPDFADLFEGGISWLSFVLGSKKVEQFISWCNKRGAR
jgi:hypothetical protein